MVWRAADLLDAVDEHSEGSVLRVRVVPRASSTRIVGVRGDAIRLELAAAPVQGAANEELLRFVAGACEVPRAEVTILVGERARAKSVLVRGRHRLEVVGALARRRA